MASRVWPALVLVLVLAVYAQPLVAAGNGEAVVFSVARKTPSLLVIYLVAGGREAGYMTVRLLAASQEYGVFEDLFIEHGIRVYRLRQAIPGLREVYLIITYGVQGSGGSTYAGSRLLGAFGFFKLSAMIPKRLLQEEAPLRLTTLYATILGRTDNGTVELGSIDLLRLLRGAGAPVALMPGYRSLIVNVTCGVEGYSVVQCRVVDGYGNPLAMVYITGYPSVYLASRLYVNMEASGVGAAGRVNVSLLVVEDCRGIRVSRVVGLRPGEPVAVHSIVGRECGLGGLAVAASTKLTRSVFNVSSIANVTLVSGVVRPSIARVDLVNYTRTGWAEWRVAFNSSRVVEASAGYVEGAVAWWLRGGGPGVVYVRALVWPGYTGGLGLTLVFDDGSVVSSYLPPPPPPDRVNYTVRVARLEPVVIPGSLYYESRIEALEEALRTPGLPYWEQMVMSYELFSRRRALETGEVPGLVAYGLLNQSITPGDYVTVVLRGVRVPGFEQCYADIYLMMGGDGRYFAEVPVKRIRLANGTYGVSVSLDQVRSWIGSEPQGALIHGVVVHAWGCSRLTLHSIDLIVAGPRAAKGESSSLWLLALAGLVPASLAAAYLALRLRSRS